MKQLVLHITLLCGTTLFGASYAEDVTFKNYDSVIVQLYADDHYEVDAGSDKNSFAQRIIGQTRLKPEDARELGKRIRQKESYGQSQALTPVYDLKIMFYRNGKVRQEVQISLWTNNLFASFSLRAQRQGECMCSGSGGYCCSEGGISRAFKTYLLTLLEEYHLPVDNKEERLNMGQ